VKALDVGGGSPWRESREQRQLWYHSHLCCLVVSWNTYSTLFLIPADWGYLAEVPGEEMKAI